MGRCYSFFLRQTDQNHIIRVDIRGLPDLVRSWYEFVSLHRSTILLMHDLALFNSLPIAANDFPCWLIITALIVSLMVTDGRFLYSEGIFSIKFVQVD